MDVQHVCAEQLDLMHSSTYQDNLIIHNNLINKTISTTAANNNNNNNLHFYKPLRLI